MAIQLLSNNILIRDGAIATNSDCCCTPPCLPCTNRCRTVYNDSCNQCIEIEGYTFTISDFEAYDPYYPCYCDEVNATYAVSNPALGVCHSVDTCVLSDFFNACAKSCPSSGSGSERFRSITVRSRFYFVENQVELIQGEYVAPLLPDLNFFAEKACLDYTVHPGHLFVVDVIESVYNRWTGSLTRQTDCFVASRRVAFFYSFNNKVLLEGCPEDQFRGNYGSLVLDFGAGTMTPVAAYGVYFTNQPLIPQLSCIENYFYDCNNYPYLCNIGTVKIDDIALPPLIPSPC